MLLVLRSRARHFQENDQAADLQDQHLQSQGYDRQTLELIVVAGVTEKIVDLPTMTYL